MKKNLIVVVIIFITVILLGLVGIQLYWIKSAIMLRESNFKRSVSEAVTNTIHKLEKIEVANAIRNRVYGTKEDAAIFSTLDSINNKFNSEMKKMLAYYTNSGKTENNKSPKKIKVKLSENELKESSKYLDTNDVAVKKVKEDEVFEVLPKMDTFPLQLSTDFYDSISSQINRFLKKTFIVNDAIEDIFCLRQYQRLDSRINFKILDSILSIELADKGINTTYEYGIYNSNKNKLTYQRTGHFRDELLREGYPYNLFPSDIFVTPAYFLIYFPYQKNFLLTSMWVMLLVSFILIVLIIFSFVYTISTIIKQRKLSEMKNDFINNMTHEFKTPVSTIALACEALSDKQIEKSSELYSMYINIIHEENNRLGVIAENVLQTALVDKGKINFKLEDVNIHDLIDKCIHNFSLQLKRYQGTINFHPEANNPTVKCDKEHIRNVINNLIDNALKYSLENPRVEIATINVQDGISISFKDNGIGINKSNQKKIFDKLFRVYVGNLHNVKGFGLGLSYVKSMVEKHGGNITVESELKKGSVFKVFLPFKDGNKGSASNKEN